MINETLSKIDRYLDEEPIDEAQLSATMNVKDNEYSNISTGLKRIQFRLERANTPQKFVDAFETVNRLVEKFPLKTKAIWQAVADAYMARYGMSLGTSTGMTEEPKGSVNTFTNPIG